MTSKHNFESSITALLFVTAIAFFALTSIYACGHTKETFSPIEKRALAQLPPLANWGQNARQLPAALEAFYDDRFALRLPLIAVHNLIDYVVFKTSGSARVMIGSAGFLFPNDAFQFQVAANSSPFTEDGVRLWARSLQAKRDYLAEHGIQYLLVLVPEKSSIYAENLPRGLKRLPGPSRLDQLQAYLKERTDVDFVDTKSVLNAHKSKSQPLYLQTDTHWNCLGSFFVAQSILSHLHTYFPSVTPYQPQECNPQHFSIPGGDLANQLALPTFFKEENYIVYLNNQRAHLDATARLPVIAIRQMEPAAYRVAEPKLPRALLLGDSFLTALSPYLADRFSKTEVYLAHYFPPQLLVGRRPNVVIEEIVERHLLDYPPDCIATLVKPTTKLPVIDSAAVAPGSQTAVAPGAQAPLATFGHNFELKDLSVKKHADNLTIKLLWQSLVAQKLDGSVNLCLLNEHNYPVGKLDFSLDQYKKQVHAGDEFVTTVEVFSLDLKTATHIAMIAIPFEDYAYPVVSKSTDMNHYRLLLPLAEAEERSNVSDQFTADSGRKITL